MSNPVEHNACGRLAAAWEVLRQIPDPEVPVISLCELGIVRALRDTAGGLEVVLTPTYSGCPATELIQDDVRAALAAFGDIQITMQRAPAWTTDWISDEGRRKLKDYGIVPPGPVGGVQPIRLVLGKRGGRLVHDDDARVAGDGPHDLDLLALGDAQARHFGEGIDAEIAGLFERLEALHVALDQHPGPRAFAAEEDVLDDVQRWREL